MSHAPPPDRRDSSDAASRWLAALVARVEGDPDVLAALSDDEIDALLAEDRARPGAVAAAVRRRLVEARHRRVRRRWTYAAGAVALAVAIGAVLFGWPGDPAPLAGAASRALAYQADLESLAGPPTKGEPAPLAAAAHDLLAAASAEPPDTALAAQSARAFERAAAEGPPGAAPFFAGLAYRVAGDEAAAQRAFESVSAGSPYRVRADREMEALE